MEIESRGSNGSNGPQNETSPCAEEKEKSDLSEKAALLTPGSEAKMETDSEVISKFEWELEAALRRLEAVEGELRSEAGARAAVEAEAAVWGRQVSLLQAQLKEAASLLEETAAPDRLRSHLRQQQLLQQVEELKAGVRELDGKCERLVQEKEEMVKEHKKNVHNVRQECDEQFGKQLRNIDQQWKLSQERLEQKLKSEEGNKELEIQILALKEDKQSLENVVHSLRQQLQQNHSEKKETIDLCRLREEMQGLREAHQKSNTELSTLRSKHAILREENCTLYAKVEDLESCEEVLRQVQARAKIMEAECLSLQSEKQEAENEAEALYSRWRSTEQEALRFKNLYFRRQPKAESIPEEEEKEECITEKVVFRLENEVDAAEKGVGRLRPEELPSGQESVLGWVQRCEELSQKLRISEANAAGLTSQLEHEQLRAKGLSEDKSRLLVQNKELSEKVAHLHRATSSMARSKLLMNQYELKIGALENERGHLQKALAQLETQLTRVHQQPPAADLEQAAKQAILLQHHNKHLKHTENFLRWRLEQLEGMNEALEAGLHAVGERLDESISIAEAAWTEANCHQETALELDQQVAASRLRSEQLERRLKQLEGQEGKENPLMPLVDELAAELSALKIHLRGQRQRAAKQAAPHLLRQRLSAATLLQKLGQQKEDVLKIKSENGDLEWAVRLEEQLSEMIDELEQHKQENNQNSSQNEEEEVSDSESSQSREEETINLRTQLLLAEQKCQELENEKRGLEAELQNLELCLEQKETLLFDQKNRLQLELQEKELEIRRCQAEATSKQVELLLCSCRPPAMESAEEDDGVGCCVGHLEEVEAALEAVHSQAVTRLRHEMAASGARLLQEAASEEGRLRQTHLAQLEEMEKQLESKESDLRQSLSSQFVDHLKATFTDLKRDFKSYNEKGDSNLLEEVLSKVEEMVISLKQQLEESFERQAKALKEAHLTEMGALSAQTQALHQQQLGDLHQELSEFGQKGENDPESRQKVNNVMKEDKERQNQALLGSLEKSVATHFNTCLQDFWRRWREKCLVEVENIQGKDVESVVERVTETAAALGHVYQAEAAKLKMIVSLAHSDLAQSQDLELLRQKVALLTKEREQLKGQVENEAELRYSGEQTLRSNLQQKHQKEMEELRTYFENQCTQMNQKYSEEIFSQQSRKHLSSSEDEVESIEEDHTKDTKMCDTFSEGPSFRPDDKILEAIEEEWRGRLDILEAEHEKTVQQLARDMQNSHQAELLDLSNEVEVLRQQMSIRKISFDHSLQNEPLNVKVDEMKELETEVARRVAEETDKIRQQVDELVESIKKQSLAEMESVEEENRRMMSECVQQRELLIEQLEQKYQQQSKELKEKHNQELEQLELELRSEHKATLDMALTEMNNEMVEKLERLETLLADAHLSEVFKLQETIKKKEAELESQQEEMQAVLEQERTITVENLGTQLQALLSDNGCEGAWSPELKQLKEMLEIEASAQVKKLEEKHAKELEALKRQKDSDLPLRDQFLQQKNLLGKENELLRGLVAELVRYLEQVDGQLNSFVETHQLSAPSTCGSDTESNASDDPDRRTVHLAPDLSAFSSFIEDNTIHPEAVHNMRIELDKCLHRLRSEVADIIGVSEASLVGSKQVDELKRLLAASEAKIGRLESQLEGREVVSEAVGAEGPSLGLEARLERITRLQDQARIAIQDHASVANPDVLVTIIQQLCAEGQHLADEAVSEKDDLLLQIESAGKVIRTNRAFMDEQAAEREQERDEFARQLQSLREVLQSRERDRVEAIRLAREVEALEAQAREQTQQLQQAQAASAQATTHLQAANDKVSVLREVVRTLELQVEECEELRTRVASLQTALEQASLLQTPEKIVQQEQVSDCSTQPDNQNMEVAAKRRKHPQSLRQSLEGADSPSNGKPKEDDNLRRLQIELKELRHSEEELQIERAELQRRLDEQLQHISSLQACLDQQRIQQSNVQDRTNANNRQAQIRSAEQLDTAKETIVQKELEIKELKAQLDKTKRVLAEQEADCSKKDREAADEMERLRQRLEAAEEEAARPQPSPRRLSLGQHTDKDVEHLSLQVQLLTDRLATIRDALDASDFSKEYLLDLMQELRVSQVEMKSHSGLLRSCSRNSEREVLRQANNTDITDFANTTFFETSHEMKLELDKGPSQLEQSMLEVKEASLLKQSMAEKESQLQKLQQSLTDLSGKYQTLYEENVQLQKALSEATVRFEEYTQTIQAELAAGQAETSSMLDISVASENLQRLLCRVQDGGAEVLSLSELAVLRKQFLEAPETTSAGTQTLRSALTEATVVADLNRKAQQVEMEFMQKEKALADRLSASEERVVSLEAVVGAERMRAADEAAQAQEARLEADKERCRASALESSLSSAQLQQLLMRAQVEGEAARHRATIAAHHALRRQYEDLKTKAVQAPTPVPVVQPAEPKKDEEELKQLQEERHRHAQREHELETAVELESQQRKRVEADRCALEASIKQLVEDKRVLRRHLERGPENWAVERAEFQAEVERLRHEAVAASAALSAERATALLERMRLQYHAPSPHHSAADDDYDLQSRLEILSGKCKQMESWRKNLSWQKRYLLLVVSAFEASHESLRRALKVPLPLPSKHTTFKGVALVIVSMQRMRIIARRRKRGRLARLLVHPAPPSPERRFEPRAPSLTPLNYAGRRDDDETPRTRCPSNIQDEFCLRSSLIQRRLGLDRQY